MDSHWNLGTLAPARVSPGDLSLQEQIAVIARRNRVSVDEARRRLRIPQKSYDRNRGDLTRHVRYLLPREQAYIICRRANFSYKLFLEPYRKRPRTATLEAIIANRLRLK